MIWMSVPGTGQTLTFAFSAGSISSGGVATKGRVLDANTAGCGEIELQDASAFGSGIDGTYAFGLTGQDGFFRFLTAGVLTGDGNGSISNGIADEYRRLKFAPGVPVTGTYTASDSTTGRGTASLSVGGLALDIIFYVISRDELLVFGTEQSTSLNHFIGRALKQSGGPFILSALNGTSVFIENGVPKVAGLATFDGAGGVVFLQDQRTGNAIRFGVKSTGTYEVSSGGRVVVTVGGTVTATLHLAGAGKGFILDTGGRSGFFEPQAAGPFGNSSIDGSYFLGDLAPGFLDVFNGVATLSGGAINEITDTNFPHFQSGQRSPDTYTISENGRAVTGSGDQIFYIISPTKFVMFDVNPNHSPSTKVAEQ
jgi:hypothetical protein